MRTLPFVWLALVAGCAAGDEPPPFCPVTDNFAVLSPADVVAVSGATTSHALTITLPFENPTEEDLVVDGVTVELAGGSATCTLAISGPASVSAGASIPAGGSADIVVDQTVTITIAPEFFGSCGWLCSMHVDTGCGEFDAATSNQLTATF